MAHLVNASLAGEFIWKNARLLDRQRYQALFHGGSTAQVIDAVRAYQNADGGFGNAIEPDIRGPLSQPVPTEMGLLMLDEAGFDASIVLRTCSYLATVTTLEGGVPFATPALAAYPHAPWWEMPDHPPASVNPTASIAGLLHKHRVQHAWLDAASAFCWHELESALPDEMHSLLCAFTFLQFVPDRQRAAPLIERAGRHLFDAGLVELDLASSSYVKKPLDWASTPASICRQFFSDQIIDANLDSLAAAQQADGGWSITWPPISPACELEWRGFVTVNALKTLRAYGRLDTKSE